MAMLFGTLQQALEYKRNSPIGPTLRIFAQEQPGGTRKFRPCSTHFLWCEIKAKLPIPMSLHEVIQEPLHLFFDLDSGTTPIHSDLIHTVLVPACTEALRAASWPCEYEHISLCTATRPSKFSWHVVLPIKGALWEKVAHVHAFVMDIQRMLRAQGHEGLADCIDLSIYGHSKQFRLLGSVSHQKPVPLTIPGCESFDYSTFKRTLVTAAPEQVAQCRTLLASKTTGVLFAPAPSKPPLLLTKSLLPTHHLPQYSPFPHLDALLKDVEFALDLPVSTPSNFRLVYWHTSAPTLHFSVCNRFCCNIGRQHRSNNVEWVVDLSTCTWHQECLDPECHFFKSTPQRLPLCVFRHRRSDVASREWLDTWAHLIDGMLCKRCVFALRFLTTFMQSKPSLRW